MPKKKKPKDRYKLVKLFLPPADRKALEKLCKQKGQPRSELVRNALLPVIANELIGDEE